MSTKYMLEMTRENFTLNDYELAEIQSSRDFNMKYYRSKDRIEESKEIEGHYFWVSGVSMSNGDSLQRNQLPTEVVVSLDNNGYPILYSLTKQRTLSNKNVSLLNNANNGLHICETKQQAQYMYNKDLEKVMDIMDRRIKTVNAIKNRLISLEQDVSK